MQEGNHRSIAIMADGGPELVHFPSGTSIYPTKQIVKDAVSIHCEITGKLLARRDAHGIYLWCKQCRTEHFTAWEAENGEVQKSDKVASEADLCYNISR